MKGSLHTDELLGAVVARDTGLRTGAAAEPCVHHGRADVSQGADRHRRRDQHRAVAGREGGHLPERHRSGDHARPGTAEGGDPGGGRDDHVEDAGDDRRRRAVQDGRSRADHRRAARRTAGVRQRDQPRARRRPRASARTSPGIPTSCWRRTSKRATSSPSSSRSWPTPTAPASSSARACRSFSPAVPTACGRGSRAALSRRWRRMPRRTARGRDGVRRRHGPFALVLNAGSSSLKFCVLRNAEAQAWRLECAARSTGIGTTPRFSATNGDGQPAADRAARPPPCATAPRRSTSLAAWLRVALRRRPRAGRRPPRRPRRRALRRPDHRDARGSRAAARADSAGAAASAVQPRGHRSRRRAAARACRRWPASTPASIAASLRSREVVPLPRDVCRDGVQRYGFHGLSYEYIASVLPRGGARDCRRAGDRRASRQRREPVRDEERPKRRQHARIHRARRPVHGHAAGRRRSGRDPLPVPDARPLRRGSRDDALQAVRPARHLRHQQRHARAAGEPRAVGASWRSTTSSTARPRKSARWPRCWAASTAWCSPRASARTRRRSAAASARPRAWLGVDLDPERQPARGNRASPGPEAASPPGSFRRTKN